MLSRSLPGAALFLLLALLLVPTARAQEPNRAGLVIEYGDGRVETACVAFSEPELSGLEFLQRAGLPLSFDAQGGGTVCAIGGVGCSFPAERCFCQCATLGAGCTYWSFHQLQPDGTWRYSQQGAGQVQVRPGEVNGWRWGAGGAQNAPPPAAITFDSICAAPAPSTTPPASPTAEPTAPLPTATLAPSLVSTPTLPLPLTSPPEVAATLPASATAEPVATATAVPSATAPPALTAAATVSPIPSESARAEQTGLPARYLLFGALALVLAGGVLWARRGG